MVINVKSFDEFMELFFTSDIFFIFLAVCFIVLLVVLIYLIKSQTKENYKEAQVLNESTNENEEDPLDLFSSIMPDNDEESAIISTEELQKASEKLSSTLEMDTSEIIEMYEEEQEKKAIISYEELLKNASSINVNYKEPISKELDEPLVKEINISDNKEDVKVNFIEKEKPSDQIVVSSSGKVMDYIEEEEFLKLLKEFRLELEL